MKVKSSNLGENKMFKLVALSLVLFGIACEDRNTPVTFHSSPTHGEYTEEKDTEHHEEVQGESGVIGIPGANGLDGKDGAIGPQGPTGLTGPQGPKGDKGHAGTNGADGQSCKVSQTLKGADIQCKDTKATILHGSTGEQGPVGPQGPKGDNAVCDKCPSLRIVKITTDGKCVQLGNWRSARYVENNSTGHKVTKVYDEDLCRGSHVAELWPHDNNNNSPEAETVWIGRTHYTIENLIGSSDYNMYIVDYPEEGK